jgi:DNA-binding phage protein
MKNATAEKHDIREFPELLDIAKLMLKKGLSEKFVKSAFLTAMKFEGVYDLLTFWKEEDDVNEREEIVADIQDMIDDCAQQVHLEAAYIKFNDIEKIANDIRRFKDNLLMVVQEKGGIKELSRLSGIPQSSLSRFFNSNSMPRRSTLLRIQNALKLSAVQIASEWSRD